MRPVIQRQAAQADIDAALSWYSREGGEQVALDFIDALEATLRHVAEYPGTGSARFAHELGLPGLRHWRLAGFPHAIFYVELDGRIEIWRVLHLGSDIPAWMSES